VPQLLILLLFSCFGFKVESIKEFEGALDKHAINLKNVQNDKNLKKNENLQYVKLGETRNQNLSMYKIDRL